MPKILLIEDEKILRENTAELLKIHGFDCITANHGEEGLSKALSEKPDLIICDIMLPYLNGFQIKEALNKNINGHQLIPFIFLSAKIERNDQRKGMDLGAADYITKPFKIAELVNSVNRRLGQLKIVETAVNSKIIESLNDFINVAKHECNTPLNSIINLSGILTDNTANGTEFLRKAHKAINTSGKRLYKTLNNLIDLVRLKEDFNLENKILRCPEIIGSINRTLSERSSFYNFKTAIKTEFNAAGEIKILQEDFEIIIFEVIDNIFKFSTGDGAKISLGTTSNGTATYITLTTSNYVIKPITFSIKDIGPFTQYNRGENEQQGSGLGLYLTKLIMEKYAGKIEISTANLQIFEVTLTFIATI